MRLTRLEIDNFKAVRNLLLEGLQDVVVLADPNGCGKSSVFDAIRLWKSAHGGYQANEWQQWFNEFQLTLGDASILKVLGDKRIPMSVDIVVQLAASERKWLAQNAENLLRLSAWRQLAPQTVGGWRTSQQSGLAEDLRVHEPEVERKVAAELPQLMEELRRDSLRGSLTIEPNANVQIDTDLVLTKIFGTYEPDVIGVIDYHGPQRTYSRERLGGINLNLDQQEEKKAHALYNYNAKYSNVKSELAAAYVQDIISKQAGVDASGNQESLLETLKELFQVFFPGKVFKGVEPHADGVLTFNVRTAAGDHDIDELSSGEKEVLYGYLRLRNSAPHNSIVLLDEPELHLNPRLVSGLPDFYYRHLGKALNNQLWLVTHSDALLRQSVGQAGFSVFHIQPPVAGEQPANQVQEIKAEQEIEQLIIELVGDLAAYRPGGKLVILEGGGKSEVDLRIIQDLFPAVPSAVNFISGGSKSRVRDFQALLSKARDIGAIPTDIISIVDADFEANLPAAENGKTYRWDRFHIENYLLEPEFMLQVMRDLRVSGADSADETTVRQMLQDSAGSTMPSLLRHRLETSANQRLVAAINTRCSPNHEDPAKALWERVEASATLVREVAASELSLERLEATRVDIQRDLERALHEGTWVSTFRGRDILKQFVKVYLGGTVGYTAFRDLVVARMRDAGFRPQGMADVLDKIVE